MFGQNIGAYEIDEKNVSVWIENDISKYEGIYHFGEGDGSNLILIINDTNITVQIRQTGYWVGGYAVEAGIIDTSELDIKWEYKNLSGLKIINGKFYSEQYQGEFVSYSDSSGQYQGLKIFNSWNKWIGKDRFEIGLKRTKSKKSFDEWFEGKYSMTSYRPLAENKLDTLSIKSLEIMRNEIYARYSYVFLECSEMDLYFQQQGWYRPRYKNVNFFLTDIELANIEIIKKTEEKRLTTKNKNH